MKKSLLMIATLSNPHVRVLDVCECIAQPITGDWSYFCLMGKLLFSIYLVIFYCNYRNLERLPCFVSIP